jgi:hypothetical protein
MRRYWLVLFFVLSMAVALQVFFACGKSEHHGDDDDFFVDDDTTIDDDACPPTDSGAPANPHSTICASATVCLVCHDTSDPHTRDCDPGKCVNCHPFPATGGDCPGETK